MTCAQSLCRVRLCSPVDCSPPGSSVLGILQARTLEWAAKPSSRRSSQARDQTYVSSVSCTGRQSLPLASPGKPDTCHNTVNSEDMMLSQISQSQKDKQCMIPLI